MNIRIASKEDLINLVIYDKHIDTETLKKKIIDSTVIVAYLEDDFIGWLRFNFFWDEHPFMNMLFVLEKYRGKGYGTRLTNYWETIMLKQRHDICMLSTMSNETSQAFYRRLGYKDIGGFIFEGEPMEIIMTKKLIARKS